MGLVRPIERVGNGNGIRRAILDQMKRLGDPDGDREYFNMDENLFAARCAGLVACMKRVDLSRKVHRNGSRVVPPFLPGESNTKSAGKESYLSFVSGCGCDEFSHVATTRPEDDAGRHQR